jgi:hypothetical protein
VPEIAIALRARGPIIGSRLPTEAGGPSQNVTIETATRPGYVPHRIERAVVGRALQFAGLALVVAGSFGPWLRSGERSRTSYELFHVADRLGFLGDQPLAWLSSTWVFVPLLAGAAVALHLFDRHCLGTAVIVLVGVYALVIGGVVLAAALSTDWGCWLAATGGAVCLVGASTSTSPHRRSILQ